MANTDSCKDEVRPYIEIINHYEENVSTSLPCDANHSISLHNKPVTLFCELYNGSNSLQRESNISLQLDQSATSNSNNHSNGAIYDNDVYNNIVEYVISSTDENIYSEATLDEMTTSIYDVITDNFYAPQSERLKNQQEHATKLSAIFDWGLTYYAEDDSYK